MDTNKDRKRGRSEESVASASQKRPKRLRFGSETSVSIDNDRQSQVTPGGVPVELLVEIGEHLLDERDLVQSQRDLSSFENVNKTHRNAIRQPALTKFRQRLADIGNTGQALYKRMIPKNGFELRGQRTAPSLRLKESMPILKFQTKEEKSALVDKVLAISDDTRRAAAIHAIAGHFDEFSAPDRKRLINRTIEDYRTGDSLYTHSRTFARNTLAKVDPHLDEGHRAELLKLTTNNRALGDLYKLSLDRERDKEKTSVAESVNEVGGDLEGAPSSSIDERINSLKTSVDEKIRRPTRETTARERLEGYSESAKETEAIYNEARAELIRGSSRQNRSR